MKVLLTTLIILLQCMNVGCINKNDVVIESELEEIKAFEDIEENTSKEKEMEGEEDMQEYTVEQNKAAIEYLKSIANNDLMADELIKTEYSANMFGYFDSSIQTIMEKKSAECVRMINENVYYIIFKEHNRYHFLEFDFTQNSSYPVCITYSENKLTLSDFDEISTNISTKFDIRMKDPYGIYSDPYRSAASYSMHFTVDGYSIRFVYDDSISPAKVYSIETKKLSHMLNEILLEQDKELLL